LTTLRAQLEQLDIKFLTEYVPTTTHVVSKKRNTSKGLQALINGKYIVSDSFITAIIAVAAFSEDRAEPCGLEQNYDAQWPDALQHLPPRGGEPIERSSSAYIPDSGRQAVFDGYTFIFYDMAQFDNLLPPITNGKGKAVFAEVIPQKTTVDEFVRYAKGVAGEKGLGSFEDGSEGKGVVVVRYVPSKGPHLSWYSEFFKSISIQLDHRPIEQNEFLEAILSNDASILRRPLAIDPATQKNTTGSNRRLNRPVISEAMDVDQSNTTPDSSNQIAARSTGESHPPAPRGRPRRGITRRFAGFDDDVDDDVEEAQPAAVAVDDDDGLFVSQKPAAGTFETTSSRPNKRPPQLPQTEDDIMDDIAPTAASVKRRRLEQGEEPVPPMPSTNAGKSAGSNASLTKKIKKEIDVLDLARQRREEVEAQAQAEKEDLARLPIGVDLEEIRRLNIVEDMEVRQPAPARTRDQDTADGRWDPRWNGRRNFKKFCQRGETAARPLQKVIVALTEVKKKDFGIGDDYWLEEESQRRIKSSGGREEASGRESQSQISIPQPAPAPPPPAASPPRSTRRIVISDESGDEQPETSSEVVIDYQPGSTHSRTTRGSTRSQAVSQSQSDMQSQSLRQSPRKRVAAPSVMEPPAKKPRATRGRLGQTADSDDSEDELKFRFRKRR
jgi:hypothetical protein